MYVSFGMGDSPSHEFFPNFLLNVSFGGLKYYGIMHLMDESEILHSHKAYHDQILPGWVK